MLRLLAILAFLSLTAFGCGGGTGGIDTPKRLKAGEAITMKGLRFHPEHVKVTVGRPVTWRNEEGVPHDVVADRGASFESRTFGIDRTYTFTPTAPGTITYECTLHPGMTGTLDVVAR